MKQQQADHGKIGPRDLYGDIQEFLRTHTRHAKLMNKMEKPVYSSIHELVLLKGVPCYKRRTDHKELSRGVKKECFNNAMNVIRRNPGKYYYAEGFALPHNGILPVHHAWVVDKKRFWTAEVTWEKLGSCYWGVLFKSTFALQKYLVRNDKGVPTHGHALLNRWEQGFPELQGDLDDGIVGRSAIRL